jgi:hypothetical protein
MYLLRLLTTSLHRSLSSSLFLPPLPFPPTLALLTFPTVLQSAEFSVLPPVEISLGDSRAHKLLVVHTNGWHAIPAPETFSRHSGEGCDGTGWDGIGYAVL